MCREDTVGTHRARCQQVKPRCWLQPVFFELCAGSNDDVDDVDGRRWLDDGCAQPYQKTDERVHGVGARGTPPDPEGVPGPSQLEHQQNPRHVDFSSFSRFKRTVKRLNFDGLFLDFLDFRFYCHFNLFCSSCSYHIIVTLSHSN